jgi:UDP-glucuronate decarboxylase
VPIILSIIFCGKSFVYNVGNDSEEISALNIAKKIKSIFKKKLYIKKKPYPKSYPSDEPKRRCPDLQKLINEFNYKPNVSLDIGLKLFKDYALNYFKK